MEFITYLKRGLGEQVPVIRAEYEGEITATELSEIETAVKHMTHEVGNEINHQVLEAQDETSRDAGPHDVAGTKRK